MLLASSSKSTSGSNKTIKKEINGVIAIQALSNESHAAIASRAGISVSDFIKFNDIKANHSIRGGEFYFTNKKKNKSTALTHTLADGEDLWLVSQRYGVSLKRIKKMNRLRVDEDLKSGEVVWLSKKKPLDQPVEEPVEVAVAKSEQGEFFDWEVNPGTSEVIVASKSKPASVENNVQVEEKSISVTDVIG